MHFGMFLALREEISEYRFFKDSNSHNVVLFVWKLSLVTKNRSKKFQSAEMKNFKNR
jgi:hypothetical protein